MSKTAKSRGERETIIRSSAEHGEGWVVFSEDPTMIRMMEKAWGPSTKRSEFGFEWRDIVWNAVRVRKPKAISEAIRAKMAETARIRFGKARSASSSETGTETPKEKSDDTEQD